LEPWEDSPVQPLPASTLRRNLATWAVPPALLPAVAHVLHDALPNEVFDPHFLGQRLETTYLDTPSFALRKARLRGDRYLTLRVRCYQAPDGGETYALSAKTEAEKWRAEVPAAWAEAVLAGISLDTALAGVLPGHLLARLQELTAGGSLGSAVTVCCRRYAVEDEEDRLTLDCDVATDTGKVLPFAVLEHKSSDGEALPPGPLAWVGLRPLKLSKFLWATSV
jgi:hypothetical protein